METADTPKSGMSFKRIISSLCLVAVGLLVGWLIGGHPVRALEDERDQLRKTLRDMENRSTTLQQTLSDKDHRLDRLERIVGGQTSPG